MENDKGHIKADDFYKRPSAKNNSSAVYPPGSSVCLKLTGEKLLILSELEPDLDEYSLGIKYLTRTVDHKKKVVFACEIRPLSENETSPGRHPERT